MVANKAQTPFSLVIITKNEEGNIERCIRSVPFASEVIVLDSGSTDRTCEIVQSLGARVVTEPWLGYAAQKQRAADLAKSDWVLSLDADEALSDEAQRELQGLLNSNLDCDAYSWPRKNYYLGRWMKHSGMYPDRQARFFHRKRAHWLNVPVHEHIVAKKVQKLNGDILHWSFTSVNHQIETINKYSLLRAQQFQSQGKKFCGLKMTLKTASKFIQIYFLKLGFLDGRQGLIVAFISSFATTLRWAKLYELEQKQK